MTPAMQRLRLILLHVALAALAFAVLVSGYILMGLWFEERDLVAEHGERYLEYRRNVRGLIPLPRKAR